jgi:hypothetical protein
LFVQIRLQYEELYNKYKQKMDLLKVLKQQQQQQQPPPAAEAAVLADFLAFLRAGLPNDEQVIIVANSTELLPLFCKKISTEDMAMIAGETL